MSWYIHPSKQLRDDELPPELVVTNRDGSIEQVYVPERVCVPHGEWKPISQMQEVRRMYCDCGHELGMDEHDSFFGTRLFAMPRYCPECGRKLVSKGRVMDE
jgi:DNA-directed RNA polymerase subunit RPC12/RpoP